MSQWFSRLFLCTSEECGHEFGELVLRVNKDQPIPCPACQSQANPTVSAPMVLRASFHDGVVRQGVRDLARASDIEGEMFDKPPSERGEYQKEIDRLRSVDGKGPTEGKIK